MATITITQGQALEQFVRQALPAIQQVLPQHINAEKFIETAIGFLFRGGSVTEKIVKCDRNSVVSALVAAAGDGLLVDGREATILPYGAEAKYSPGVVGIMKKVRNSGEVSVIGSEVVHEKDEYDRWTDENGEHFRHRPARGNRGDVILTYAYARLKDGGMVFEEIDEGGIEDIAACSRGGAASPWQGKFRDEMRRKSVIRRLSKRLPMSSDADVVIRRDDDLYDMTHAVAVADDVPTVAKSGSRLAQAMGLVPAAGSDPTPPEPAGPTAATPKPPSKAAAPKPPSKAAAPKPPSKAPVAPAESIKPPAESVDGLIEEFQVAEGTKKDGTPWSKVGIKIGNLWYSSFSDSHREALAAALDAHQEVRISWRMDGKYRNIQTVDVLVQEEAASAGPDWDGAGPDEEIL